MGEQAIKRAIVKFEARFRCGMYKRTLGAMAFGTSIWALVLDLVHNFDFFFQTKAVIILVGSSPVNFAQLGA